MEYFGVEYFGAVYFGVENFWLQVQLQKGHCRILFGGILQSGILWSGILRSRILWSGILLIASTGVKRSLWNTFKWTTLEQNTL